MNNYLELAESDLAVATRAIDSLKDTASAVTISLEQTVEKCFCHLLQLKNAKFEKTHSCEKLLILCKGYYDDIPCEVNDIFCRILNIWYHNNRYPSMMGGLQDFKLIKGMFVHTQDFFTYTVEKDKLWKENEK